MTERETAVFQVWIRGTIQAVWDEITKTREPQGCFFNMRLYTPGLAPGQPMQMRTKSGKYVGAVGEVLEISPPFRYAHTFRFTSNDDPPCRVIYELKELNGGVEFTMRLEDLPAGTVTAKQMKQGGPMITKTLKAIVETGRPTFGVRLIYTIMRWTEWFSPKRCQVENWPMPAASRSSQVG